MSRKYFWQILNISYKYLLQKFLHILTKYPKCVVPRLRISVKLRES